MMVSSANFECFAKGRQGGKRSMDQATTKKSADGE